MTICLRHANIINVKAVLLNKSPQNIHIHMGVNKADFIQMREQRDATLTMPKLILPAIQTNMDAG